MTMYALDLCSLRDLLNPPAPAADRLLCWLPAFIFIRSQALLACFFPRATSNGGLDLLAPEKRTNTAAAMDVYAYACERLRGPEQERERDSRLACCSFPWPASLVLYRQLQKVQIVSECRSIFSCIIAGHLPGGGSQARSSVMASLAAHACMLWHHQTWQ